MKIPTILIALLSIVTGCSRKVDIEQQKAQLFEVDRTFSEVSAEFGTPEAFQRYMADSATLLRDGSYPITGSEAIGNLFTNWPPNGKLTWEPVFADVSSSGDLGYTIGEYLFTNTDSSGNEISGGGYYITIWKKQADGQWKYVFDTGTDGLPEKGE